MITRQRHCFGGVRSLELVHPNGGPQTAANVFVGHVRISHNGQDFAKEFNAIFKSAGPLREAFLQPMTSQAFTT